MSNQDKEYNSLFSEFPPISREEWERQIKEDLNGADYQNELRWNTGEGVNVLPFYRREDLDDLNRKGPITDRTSRRNDWEIRQPVFGRDINSASKQIGQAGEKGADGYWITVQVRNFEGALGGDLSGTPIQSQNDFNTLCSAADPEKASLHFDSGMATPAILAMLYNYAQNADAPIETHSSTFLYDPFSYTLENGRLPKPVDAIAADCRKMVEFSEEYLAGTRTLGVDGRIYHNAGGTIIQELAAVLSAGNEYLATLTNLGLEPRIVARNIHFTLPVGSNYFLEIAKFRALRFLWSQILETYESGLSNLPAYIHGQSSGWNKSIYDPYTNMLRSTTEGMSAALAGCDAITIFPFDFTFRQPDDFSTRIARNSQIIFKEEAYLDKVADPSAGSYYIETLTDKIGEKSWETFQELEQQGGILKSIESGTVQMMIDQSRKDRNRAIAYRKKVFIGTNQYPNPDETIKDEIGDGYTAVSLKQSEKAPELPPESFMKSLAGALDEGALLGDLVAGLFNTTKHEIPVLQPYRGARAFEEIRLSTELHEKTPRVLTLPLGDRSKRKARSSFALGFFGCAGYEIIDPIGFESTEEAMQEVRNQRPDIVVICSSDEEYRKLVPELCPSIRALKDDPVIVLAGYPEENIEKFKKAGIDEFIYTGCNVLETLEKFQSKLGIY